MSLSLLLISRVFEKLGVSMSRYSHILKIKWEVCQCSVNVKGLRRHTGIINIEEPPRGGGGLAGHSPQGVFERMLEN